MKHIFISAGDPSGDKHAAKVMAALNAKYPGIRWSGIGGEEMTAQGLNSIVNIKEISVTGFWEVAKRYFFFKKLLDKCFNILTGDKPDLFLPVDYPGFNLRLCEFARKNNIPVTYYIAPQLWAWGKNRAAKLAASVDKLLVVFPFEEEFFRKSGINAEFIGHPLLDNPAFSNDFPKFQDRENTIALFPGSRKQELAHHLPILNEAGKIILKEKKDFNIKIACSGSVDKHLFDSIINDNPDWSLCNDSGQLMLNSKAAIIKTGTSNLEAVLSGIPFAMFYKTSAVSYQMSKRLVNLPYVSLANILSNKFIVNEFIQHEASPKSIAREILRIISSEDYYNEIQDNFYKIKLMLGGAGASVNVANKISEYL